VIEDAVVYHSPYPIAGVRPFFVLTNEDQVNYFESCGGAPEAELITWAAQFLDPYREFLDIGSHVGTWGITYALRGHAKVVCYEANPQIAKLCNAGFALNGMANKCKDYGIWHENDLMPLMFPYRDGGGGSVVRDFSESGYGTTATMKSLDQFAHTPGFIKIDVEGAELNVLQGATQTILLDHPTILFECWADERGQRKEDLFRYLNDELEYGAVNVTGWPEMYLAEPL
jgi:FkbM family methyltransferase